MAHYQHSHNMSATFVPGMDDYYEPPAAPELMAPKPNRVNHEMPNQIADGIENMDINANGRQNTMSPGQQKSAYSNFGSSNDSPHLSPFPKLVNPPPNVPPSDDELEVTLENARTFVLNSNDPEMQLAWAADALIYVGVCADNEERIAAAKPQSARSATPRVEHQLKEDAMNIVTFLADQHHPKAEFLRGMWLEWGRFGQREDKKEAFRCYSRAADRQYARAEYRIGMLYESYNDPVKALRHYHRGVEAGDAASCYRLGMMTLRGQHGQQQDLAKGIELIQKSAEVADENAAQGAYVYGMLLARQLPQVEVPDGYLEFDERKARMNIEKAAYLKFAKAQLKMGSAYELGSLGCEFSPSLSIHYNALASKQGEAEADMSLSKWFLVGSEGLFPKNEELAYTYAERAAQGGLATAEFALGYFHEIGMYVPVDLDRALEWYHKAAKHGNADASGRIEGLSRKQVLSRKDHEQVAISRIKSQHGSMRGQRPERFQQQQQKPSRLGQSTTIDEVSQAYNNASAGIQSPPPRGSSITPYPEDNGPPKLPPDNRSQSVAPYPLEDGPPKRLGPVGGFFNVSQPPRPSTTLNPDVRPSSAFQINPDVRPNSVAQPQYNGQPAYYGGGGGPPPGMRPATTQPMDPRHSPAPPMDPRFRPQPNNRVPSGPGPQNYPPTQQTTPRPPMPSHQNTAPAAPPQQQRLDIGFSAPYDDRRNRQYGPRPNPPPSNPSSTSLQSSQSMPVDRPSPLNVSSKPSTPKPPAVPDGKAGGVAPKPPQKDAKPAAPGKAAARPPGKGPKTFDEMGVPAQQKDGECAVM